MLMTDAEISQAMVDGEFEIIEFSQACLQPASYDMRLGAKALATHRQEEVNVEKEGSIIIKAGDFALLSTHEKVRLPRTIAGHIGVRSYFTRKGLVLLAGLQIDPGFEGALVLGVYNASPRNLVLDYLAPFCTVEFHRLSRPTEQVYKSGEEQRQGKIPAADKDYLRTLETQTLSEMSSAVRGLSMNVQELTLSMKAFSKFMYLGVAPLLLIILGVFLFFALR